MAPEMKRPRATWLERDLIRSQYIGLCTTEAQYRNELRRIKLPRAEWPSFTTKDAAVHFLTNPKHGRLALVTIQVEPHRTLTEVIGLLAHEGLHIWQAELEDMSETRPGKEVEAYAVQSIVQRLVAAYCQQVGLGSLMKKGSAHGVSR